ncbi:uncharacterized protein [Heptranchias perlo]|uniref:uncharacterized protein n=1 Tax=Heptranchias perlo TaxID=212740 RepID=UPI003559911C
MDSLYASLRNEIRTFDKHVQSCRDSFDLTNLSRFLSVLTEQDPESVNNLQRVRYLASSRDWNKLTFNDGSSDVNGYGAWLVAYVDYLRGLKETFDDKVVIPLCENLYVNEETESLGLSSDSSNLSSSTSSQASDHHQRQKRGPGSNQAEVPTDSIPKIAKELFNVRRRWALLLNHGIIKDEYFNPQSITDLHKVDTPKHLTKILRLIPDVFYKGLLAADLSSQWVDLHECRYGVIDLAVPLTKGFYNDCEHTNSKVFRVREKEPSMHKEPRDVESSKDPQRLRAAFQESSEEADDFTCMKPKLRVDEEELDFLLRREERVKTLEKQTQDSDLRIHNLQSQLERAKQEIEMIQQQKDFEVTGKAQEGTVTRRRWTILRHIEALEKQLNLEKYQYKILEGDWMLELEIRPSLIRHMDMLQDVCEKSGIGRREDSDPAQQSCLNLTA